MSRKKAGFWAALFEHFGFVLLVFAQAVFALVCFVLALSIKKH